MLPISEPISIFDVKNVRLTEELREHFRKDLNEADKIHSVYAFKDGSLYIKPFNGFLVVTGPILQYQLYRGNEALTAEWVGAFTYDGEGNAIIPDEMRTVFDNVDRNRIGQWKGLAQALHFAVLQDIKRGGY
jgi:hypothetical protein